MHKIIKSRRNVWSKGKFSLPLHSQNRGVEQLVARQAHNLEVARSSRTSATKKKSPRLDMNPES